MSAKWKGDTIELTEKEFMLLHKLLSYPGVLFTKQQLMDEVWGYDTESDYNTIKTYVNRLRNKLADCDMFEIISARGIGYKAEIHA
ncbi:MAG: winged helix-turn-helix transcriptional regulator [Lachnospiraceae bacterium]|nr:winged helix-turn-helix transcriptional regulator [Lachnospiraceae bacterium]